MASEDLLHLSVISSSWILALLLAILTWILASFVLPKLHNHPPAVPGLPILGNLLQVKEKKPIKTFGAWADKYGPIFTVKLGAETMVIISSAAIAKEAMITKYASISTRKMSKALYIITSEKTMVAMSDYGDEHRMLKRLIINNLLGPIPQKSIRSLREKTYAQIIDDVYAQSKNAQIIDVRECIKRALFFFSMSEVIGKEPEQVFVEEFGRSVEREEMLKVMQLDPLTIVLKVDWRDFFPYLRWIPNRALEDEVKAVRRNADAIVRALIHEEKLLLANGKRPDCLLDVLLSEATHLTEKQLIMSTWEPIIEAMDTTLISIEWAIYELTKNPSVQEKLLEEIRNVTGNSRPVTEDDLPKLHYLTAVVKETLRTHAPVPLIPPRHVDEDIQLGGYNIKKGWQILVNIHAINNAKETWSNPEVWNPDRLLGDEDLDMGFKDHRILTFGTGKRMCPGIAQAMCVISMTLALMVQHFHWSFPADEQDESEADMDLLSNHKLHPLRAIPVPRFPPAAKS